MIRNSFRVASLVFGNIDVAKAVLADSKTVYKPEILTLSKQIIKNQEADNNMLKMVSEQNQNVQTKPEENGHSELINN